MNEDIRKIVNFVDDELAADSLTVPADVDATPSAGATPSVFSMSFGEVREHMLVKYSNNGKPTSTGNNIASTLNGFMRSRGLESDDPVGDLLGSGFDSALQHYLGQLNAAGKNSAAPKSHMRTIHAEWLKLLKENGGPRTFGATLTNAMRRCGMSAEDVAKAVYRNAPKKGIVERWMGGALPSSNLKEATIRRYERVLGMQPDELWSLLPHAQNPESKDKAYRNRKRTAYGRKIQANHILQYRLSIKKLPEQLNCELDHLVWFETCDTDDLLERGMRRSSTWRETKPGKNPTAENKSKIVIAMQGFARLPKTLSESTLAELIAKGFKDQSDLKEIESEDYDPLWDLERAKKAAVGKGYALAELSLALLSDWHFCQDHYVYAKNRSMIDHEGLQSHMSFVCLLTRPFYGYLWWHEHYANRLPADIRVRYEAFCRMLPEDERSSPRLCWRAWCAATHAWASDKKKKIKNDPSYGKSRDPNEPIAEILDSKHPLLYLRLLRERVQAVFPRPEALMEQARMATNLLLVGLLMTNPLRAKMFAEMKWDTNLYQREDGSWWIKFDGSDFKNWKAAKHTDYDWPVPRFLWKEIEDYQNIYRPHLYGAGKTKKVFLNHSASKKPGLSERAISDRLSHITFHFLGLAFSAHAFRHIAATAYLTKHRGDWAMAAAWLHDTEATIRKYYFRFRVKDHAAVINQFIDDELSLPMEVA